MGGNLTARIGDAIVLIGFVALAAVLVRPHSQTASIIGSAGNAYGGAIKAAENG